MSFILGVLILGALLSVIFGKAVGQLFVLGTGTIVMLFFGVLLVLLSPMIFHFLFDKPTPSSSYSYQSSPAYGSPPAYGSSQTYAPVTQTPAPTYQASSPPPAPATGTGPRLGVDIVDNPANSAQYTAYLHPPVGAGAWIRVHPGSPAEAAGLRSYDVILSAGTQTQPADWITPSNQLSNYLDRVGYNVPVRVHIYRATGPCDFWTWVHPR